MRVMLKSLLRKTLWVALLPAMTSFASHAAELVVWSAGAVKPAVEEIFPEFQKQSGIRLQVQYAPVGVWMRRLAEGGQPDVLILSSDVIKEVESKGWSVPGSATPLGNVVVGVAVKQGAKLPDVSTPEALRSALLAAKSITYMDPQKGTSGKHFAGVLEQLGIAEQVKSKTTLGDAGYVMEPVARGEIELGIQQITEILPVKGAVLVGPLPPSLQKTTTYVMAQGSRATDRQAVTALGQFLQSPAALESFKRAGFILGN
jgi:molybdate transport system substrate-binding protein